MTPAATALVLVSAFGHVYWNFHLKRSPEPAIYAWWMQVTGAALCAPIGLYLAWPVSIPLAGWGCVAATGLIYGAYYALIGRSYRGQDMSRAYPIARGVAPVATAIAGFAVFAERPSAGGWLGVCAICVGLLALAWRPGGGAQPGLRKQAVLAAIATGLCTAAYSAVDKAGVQLIHPALYISMTFLAGAVAQAAWLLPLRGSGVFLREVRRDRVGLAAAAGVSTAAYLLVLLVLRTALVSYVVPLRSTSVLMSLFVGSRLLGEEIGPARVVAACLIVAGISAIAVGG